MTEAQTEESGQELENTVQELALVVLPGVVAAIGNEIALRSNQGAAVDHAFYIAEQFVKVAALRRGSVK